LSIVVEPYAVKMSGYVWFGLRAPTFAKHVHDQSDHCAQKSVETSDIPLSLWPLYASISEQHGYDLAPTSADHDATGALRRRF
jgi:hypothetical protein